MVRVKIVEIEKVRRIWHHPTDFCELGDGNVRALNPNLLHYCTHMTCSVVIVVGTLLPSQTFANHRPLHFSNSTWNLGHASSSFMRAYVVYSD